jgi:hypothetical protein
VCSAYEITSRVSFRAGSVATGPGISGYTVDCFAPLAMTT